MDALSRRAVCVSAAAGAVLAAVPASAPHAAVRPASGDMSLGDPKAPVRVVEYISLSCSHCATFHLDVFPAFKAKYVDTGKVYYTVRELLTAPAQVAAAGFLLARCNGGTRYFTIVDQVFRSQSRWSSGQIKPIFVEIAKNNGITEAQFETCLADEKANDALSKRIEYATGVDKVTGTPTFFVNGVMLSGGQAPDLAELDAAVAKAMKAVSSKSGGRR